jgi:putative exosortase-associated protein (TIGR04073 family)
VIHLKPIAKYKGNSFMKKTSRFFLLFVVLYFLSYQNAHAGAFVKLGRGLTNIITSPAEVIYQPSQLSQENNMWVAWFGGISKGLVFIPVRMLAGVYEVITFPIPIPSGHGPLMEPPTVVEGFRRLDL